MHISNTDLKIIDKDTGQVLFPKVWLAQRFFQKFKGLMFRKGLSEDEALTLHNTSSIHTFFMRFPIDIIFLDKNMQVIKICGTVLPWRTVFCRGAFYTIECLGGQTYKKGIRKGQSINFL